MRLVEAMRQVARLPNPCTVCDHRRAPYIGAQVAGGRTLLSVSREVGVSYDALRRHVRNGHGGVGRAAPETSGPASVEPVGSTVEVLRDAMDALRRMDPTRLSPSAQVARIDAIRRAAEALAKAEPVSTHEEVVDVTGDRPRGIRELFSILADELEVAPCPSCGNYCGPGIRARINERMKAGGLA